MADTYGTDVEIYRSSNGLVRADCRTPTPGLIDRILRRFGFTAPTDPASYHLPPEQSDPDQRLAASGAAGLLDAAGYRVAIEPDLVVGYVGNNTDVADRQRTTAARLTSPSARTAPSPAPAPIPPTAPRPNGRTR
ncbi:hypothetical protein [Kitasatospora phosalacinea]|uniref:Uncharacterized protein n=1 Tax=Kitasatospora phosalacinea TaxID=2065 RepID=A0A9W6PNK6_9ACTN|nr:hypothetical protein [Kitasatospora phosalacinea]GLW57997.1 hypothetical protein Kpho01_60080 [Kitasatospora phosalacinea]